MSNSKGIPTAKPAGPRLSDRAGKISIIWVLPAAAALIGGDPTFERFSAVGPSVTIIFNDGSGIQPGQTVVRYRGTKVGMVNSVALTKDGGKVEVHARMDKSAKLLARAGAQFWVVRPQVNAGALHGLDTIVSGSYIQVEPGAGPEKKEFTGRTMLPMPGSLEPGLDLVLITPHIGTLNAGAPVFFRGLEVGTVQSPVLNGEATGVEVHIQIQQRYADLVRQNSVFWNAGGLEVRLKFFSVNINAESMKSLVVGGVAFANPPAYTPPASANSVFALNDKPEEKWLKWAAPLPGWAGTNGPPTNTPPAGSFPPVSSLTNGAR